MRILVTGAAGRLGRALLPALLADTRFDAVTALDLVAPALRHPRLTVIAGDLLGPMLVGALEGVDAVIHLAAAVLPARLPLRRAERASMRRINVDGTRRVVELACAAGVSRVIHASSVAVYGAWPDNPPLLDEEWPRRATPGFAYSEDKVAAEDWLDTFAATGPRLTVTRLRLHAIVGPHAPPLLNALARSRFFPRVPEPEPSVQCLWESDAVAAVLAAIAGPPGIYNVAAPGPQPYRALACLDGRFAIGVPYGMLRRTQALVSRFTAHAGEPGWLRGLRYPLVVATGRAESALNWRARVTVAECVRRSRQIRR